MKKYLLLACFLAASSLVASPLCPIATGENYAYYELVATVNTTGQNPATWYPLLEIKDIASGGYKSIQFFLTISEFPSSENIKDKGSLYSYIGHNMGGNPVFYKDGSVALRSGVGDFLVVDAPIIGTSTAVSIYGVSLPPGTVKMNVSAYLIK